MREVGKYENVANGNICANAAKNATLRSVISNRFAQVSNEAADSKLTRKEELKKLGLTEEEVELEKAMYMYQCYPCLRNNISSYIPILKEKVIGQDKALEMLTYVAYYNQYVNFIEEYTQNENYKRKSMLLIAPTGCGKSTMLRALEKAFNVPVYRANITATTSAGYIGDKVESMLVGLIERADGDINEAQRGILLIDEIDKKITSTTTDRDVAGKAVQQELLKLFEKGTVSVPFSRKSNGKDVQTIDFETGSLTIILAGACVGLDEVRKNRLGTKKTIGFTSVKEEKNDSNEYITEDLIEYGFIPELVGRIDIIQELEPYTQSKLIDIIYFSDESSMQEHVRILVSLGVEEVLIDGALWEIIAEKILENNLGIRELNRIMTKLFYPVLYEAFQHVGEGSCKIDADGSYTLRYKDEDVIYTGKGIEIGEYLE